MNSDKQMKKRRWWYLPALLVLLVATILILRDNAERNAYTTFTGSVFGTTYKITFQGRPALIDSCMATLSRVDEALSMFNDSSNLSRINRGETDSLCAMTAEVLTLALKVSDETDGCFDVTVGPLVNAWGFGFKSGSLPDSAAVDSLMRLVGYKRLSIDGGRITRPDMTTLDCSAIAKGYGCDAVARALADNGVANMLVEIGGEVVTKGVNAEGRQWKVGVSRPSENTLEQDIMEVIELNDGAMATSGNYRNFRIESDGRKIAHTIDPHNGYPVRHSLLSATVFAPSCAMADAYATAFMVMGEQAAGEILDRHPELSALLIIDDNGSLKVINRLHTESNQ